jgi:hypothetical protein
VSPAKPWLRPHPVGRPLEDDQRAVSSVLGAILLFGLLVVTILRIRIEFVPVWDHDREADFMARSSAQFAQIKTDLDRQVANQTSASITDPLSLGGGGGFSFFRGVDKAGTLTFTPRGAGEGFTIESNQLTIQSRDGVALEGLQTYTNVVSPQTASNVVDIPALKVRLNDPLATGPGATLRIDLTSGTACAGQLVVSIGGLTATRPRNIAIQTFTGYSTACVSPTAQPIHSRDLLIGCANPCVSPTTFFFDALEPELVFNQVLAAATKPLTVTMTETGSPPMDASVVFVYDQAVAGGINRVGGGGLVAPGFQGTLSVGTLTVSKENSQYPSQTLVLEYGAIILDQQGDAAMAYPPLFTVNTTATQARLDIVLPALTGTPNQVGASAAATVTSVPAGVRGSIDAIAPRITISVTTDFPGTWTDYWDETLLKAGFTKGTHFTTGPTPNGATMTFFGPEPAPNDLTTNDIVLHLQTSPLEMALRATG